MRRDPCRPVVIELDEEQHFNHYRAATLRFSWAEELPWTSAYRDYSRLHEPDLARKFVSGGAGLTRRLRASSVLRQPRVTSQVWAHYGGGSGPFTTR